jgi:hypothetical protein
LTLAAAAAALFVQVLAKVEEANQVGRKLPPDGFYNQLIRWGSDAAGTVGLLPHACEDGLRCFFCN